MKHLLNNLSEEEKNSIREQHSGGMKVMTENFHKLVNSKLGNSKPLVSEQILSEGVGQNNFKMGQTFDEVHNRAYNMAKEYRTAASGGGAKNYNSFEFRDPKVYGLSNSDVTFRIDYGYYIPTEVWKKGEKETNLNNFCLTIPFNKIGEIRGNQVMVNLSNTEIASYIQSPCKQPMYN